MELKRLCKAVLVVAVRSTGSGFDFVCPECGSDEVQQSMWVNWNTQEIMDTTGHDDWCDNCGDNIKSAIPSGDFGKE